MAGALQSATRNRGRGSVVQVDAETAAAPVERSCASTVRRDGRRRRWPAGSATLKTAALIDET
ncbi:hypothetical protein EFW17_03425 [Halostreptopolyspora alba]|uniref:Uncharacterized protein n=1 Tax=Halostreptopolyspora alba TaxID=2487137 RepID=A0A3N0EGD0_9ACTN|nr:hypothetical protein EFW17_03425 [Nocardiopsaceae bacterium YIM 96095]